MGDVTPSASSQSCNSTQDPCLTGNTIDDLGLTLLTTGGPLPALDVIFVHGLQGHPEYTWAHVGKADKGTINKRTRVSKLKFWKTKSEGSPSSAGGKPASMKNDKVTYWPTELLAPDLPTARVFTYGYDSSVTHFFSGPASQNTITDNGRALLSSIASQRLDCIGRPLMLIVHFLGGIVVKSALRISALANENDTDMKGVCQSTFAVLFFGTPHRGSDWTDAGQIARKFAAVLGFSTTDHNLQALKGNTEILEILRDDFARMLGKEAFYITSFQESKGFKGIRGLDAKIVEPDSSGLDHFYERKIPINANHLDMCKFALQGPTRKDYDEKVRSEIIRHWRRESRRLQEELKKFERNATKRINDDCNELLESLDPADTSRRFEQVEQAHRQTFEWLFVKPELGFESWLTSGTGLYWCKGHPASGKSTLMKWAYNDPRTVEALTTEEGRNVKATFFFHDRGSEIQKSFRGLLQGIVYQILQDTPELLPLIAPIRRRILKRFDSHWTEEDINKAFEALLSQQILPLSITLFLDALDEYNGRHDSIASFLYNTTNSIDTALTKIKVCFSSRPLQILLDKFSGVPGFYIQEHTMEDIKLVIHSKMSQNPRMSTYVQAASSKNGLIAAKFAAEVSSRAEGIFLWVKLVLDELLDDFTAGETIQGLIKKLGVLPPKLENFYQHILDRLPSQYREDTEVIFEVLRCAIQHLHFHDFFDICQYTKLEKLVDCTACKAIKSDYDSVQRWIRSRTGGLVLLVPFTGTQTNITGGRGEDFICPASHRYGESAYVVQFLHQTVKMFSQGAGSATHLTGHRFPRHLGDAYIARYILALLYHNPLSDSDHERRSHSKKEERSEAEEFFWPRFGAYHLIFILCSYISLAESKIPKVLVSSLLEFGDDNIRDLFQTKRWTEDWGNTPFNCVSALAVALGLSDLLDELMKRKNSKHSLSSPPLLHLAVGGKTRGISRIDSEKRSRTIRCLLDNGANSKEVFQGCTPYERLCKLAFEHGFISGVDELSTVVMPFLQTGQDPNVDIEYEQWGGRRGYLTRMICLLHYAAALANCEMIYTVLEYGADVNAIDDAGSTPLDYVCDGTIHRFDIQLSHLITDFLEEPPESRPKEELYRILQAASLLISRGGRFGLSSILSPGDKFFLERLLVTEGQIKALRSRGIDIDDRIIRRPQNQIKTGISSFIIQPFNIFKRHAAG